MITLKKKWNSELNNFSGFHQCFKKLTGKTPHDYKKNTNPIKLLRISGIQAANNGNGCSCDVPSFFAGQIGNQTSNIFSCSIG